MKKTLLILGAGIEQTQAYIQAKAMDLYVVGTDINPDAPAFEESHAQLICSTRDIQQTIKAVKKFNDQHPIHGVMTVANDVALTVACVANELNISGISVNSASNMADKISMKKQFIKRDISTPAYKAFTRKEDFQAEYIPENGPQILKPSDGRGSRGVLYLDSSIDSNWAWDESIKHSENGMLLLEEYITGPQLSVEGLMQDGTYYAAAFADRNYENMASTKPFIIEDGGVIPSRFPDDDLDKVRLLIENAAKSMDIHWGPVKADIILASNGPVIIEITARLSGNYLATHHIPMAYGVNIVDQMIKMSLGEKLDYQALKPKWKKYLGVRYFFPRAGKIKAINGVDEVKDLEYLRYLDIYKRVGDSQVPIHDHTTRAGTIICEGRTYKEAKSRVERTVDMISFDIVYA